jgi:hypothetical protein
VRLARFPGEEACGLQIFSVPVKTQLKKWLESKQRGGPGDSLEHLDFEIDGWAS